MCVCVCVRVCLCVYVCVRVCVCVCVCVQMQGHGFGQHSVQARPYMFVAILAMCKLHEHTIMFTTVLLQMR